jgi:predicted nucleic acid-binding protein
MTVIADTGPINYLILIREIQILPALYGRILVPASVDEELKPPRSRCSALVDESASDLVRSTNSSPPC